jgi:hypothetical protein
MAKGRERVERGERRPAKITIRWQPLSTSAQVMAHGALLEACRVGV